MNTPPAPDRKAPVTVIIVRDNTLFRSMLTAVRRTPDPVMIVTGPETFRRFQESDARRFFVEARALNPDRPLTLASKDQSLVALAVSCGWTTIRNLKQLRSALKDHPSLTEAARIFSPVSWRQNIRTRLQSMGVLSVPKIRIWTMFLLSIGVFLFIFLRILPSAVIVVRPNQDIGNFSMNVYLTSSGANNLPVPADRVRTLPLTILTINVHRSMTYDQISKKFTGSNAEMSVTVVNDSDEQYSLRKGTRIVNQAGMVFRLQSDVILPPHAKESVRAVADALDQYGEVLGERGNVPAGIKWDIPGLTERERVSVYARNDQPTSKGKTSYLNVVSREDIEGTPRYPGARQRLETELLSAAQQQIEEERIGMNERFGTHLVQLPYRELTKLSYRNFSLSESFIGQNVSSIPIEGDMEYSVALYDEMLLLSLLRREVEFRTPPGKVLVESSLSKDNIALHIIPPWDDDLRWVKITADLTYVLRYYLNPLSPSGALFGKYVRENVAGKSKQDAYRIINNMPEVSKVTISLWPPWALSLPTLGNNIAIREEVQ